MKRSSNNIINNPILPGWEGIEDPGYMKKKNPEIVGRDKKILCFGIFIGSPQLIHNIMVQIVNNCSIHVIFKIVL